MDGGNQSDGFVGGRGAHVGQLLFSHDVDVEVGIARVFADDHAFVNFGARTDENLAALLKFPKRVAGRSCRDRPPGIR